MTKKRLKTLIGILKLTQSEFANLLGVNPSTVHRWLNGEVKIPRSRVEHIRAVAESRGVRV